MGAIQQPVPARCVDGLVTLKVKCRCCPKIIEVTAPPNFVDTEPYDKVLARGNVLCQDCFRRLSLHLR